jgi:hypothetical protein
MCPLKEVRLRLLRGLRRDSLRMLVARVRQSGKELTLTCLPGRNLPEGRAEAGSPVWTTFATVQVGVPPPKHHENRGHNSRGGNGEIEPTSGAREAEQLFDPERA